MISNECEMNNELIKEHAMMGLYFRIINASAVH